MLNYFICTDGDEDLPSGLTSSHRVLEPDIPQSCLELGYPKAVGEECEGGVNRKPQNLQGFDEDKKVPNEIAGGLGLTY